MRPVAHILAEVSGLQTDSEGFVRSCVPGPGGYLEVRRQAGTEPTLVYHGPARLLPGEVANEIRARRQEIIEWFERPPSSWTAHERATLGFGPEPVEEPSPGITRHELGDAA